MIVMQFMFQLWIIWSIVHNSRCANNLPMSSISRLLGVFLVKTSCTHVLHRILDVDNNFLMLNHQLDVAFNNFMLRSDTSLTHRYGIMRMLWSGSSINVFTTPVELFKGVWRPSRGSSSQHPFFVVGWAKIVDQDVSQTHKLDEV